MALPSVLLQQHTNRGTLFPDELPCFGGLSQALLRLLPEPGMSRRLPRARRSGRGKLPDGAELTKNMSKDPNIHMLWDGQARAPEPEPEPEPRRSRAAKGGMRPEDHRRGVKPKKQLPQARTVPGLPRTSMSMPNMTAKKSRPTLQPLPHGSAQLPYASPGGGAANGPESPGPDHLVARAVLNPAEVARGQQIAKQLEELESSGLGKKDREERKYTLETELRRYPQAEMVVQNMMLGLDPTKGWGDLAFPPGEMEAPALLPQRHKLAARSQTMSAMLGLYASVKTDDDGGAPSCQEPSAAFGGGGGDGMAADGESAQAARAIIAKAFARTDSEGSGPASPGEHDRLQTISLLGCVSHADPPLCCRRQPRRGFHHRLCSDGKGAERLAIPAGGRERPAQGRSSCLGPADRGGRPGVSGGLVAGDRGAGAGAALG